MAVSFVQSGSHTSYDATHNMDPTTYFATFSSTPSAGNLLLLAISLNTTTGDPLFTTPDGWNHIATWDCQLNDGQMGWYYRIATAGEGTKVTIVGGPTLNETEVFFISEWTGIDGDDPFHDGATFTGTQVTVAGSAYTTSTLSGTRDMLYLSWGQWENQEFTAGLATVGNGFATRLDADMYNDRFIQADFISTLAVPAACNWTWTGPVFGSMWKYNINVIGFSGSSGAPPPATFGPGQYCFDNTVFGGLVNFAVPLEEMPDFYPTGEEIRQDFHTSHVGKAWHYDWFRRPVHRMIFNAVGTDTAATLGSLVDQNYAFLFYDQVGDSATAGTGTYIFIGPYRRFDYGPNMCEFDITIAKAD